MRVCALVAFGLLIAASSSADAADCTKGMLWPYVRNSGDCLTDAEIQAGKTGVYSGPLNTDPDLSAIKPEDVKPPAQEDCGLGLWWPFVKKECPSSVVTTTGIPQTTTAQGALANGSAQAAAAGNAAPVANASAAPPAAASAAPVATSSGTASASCEKGLLWPFVRDAGDCPTDIEKQQAKGRAARGGVATASNQAVPIPASGSGRQVPAVTPATVTQPAQIPAATPARNDVPAETEAPVAACHKGLFWPFVRDPGDCPTTAEKDRERKAQSQ
jgi:hypothetical protein